MSAATTVPGAARALATARSGPTFARLLAAEWTKLTSLRSPWWVAAVTVLVTGAITYLSAQASSVDSGFQPVDSLSTGLVLGQVGPLVLGVLVGAGEFRTGAFRTTFTLAPRRLPVLAAQVLALTAFALALAVAATAACVVGIWPPAASRGIAVDLTGGDAPGLMLGMVAFGVGLALFGLALGALVRRTVPAMLTGLFAVLILPIVLMMVSDPMVGADPASTGLVDGAVPTTVPGTLMAFSPGGAAQLMTIPASYGPIDGAPDLGPVGGGLVLLAWIVVLLAAAAVRLHARDVR
ncbi:ABC transporter permease subunit [Actinotalea subterranea]|uniref:ABC transporter permease subunit n=1 Tax=Actinotalea subterranea TaxID=2607497 RepID=UPI0011EEE437|nr:ABC transporter permease subunit [Actinotalea subterranea]